MVRQCRLVFALPPFFCPFFYFMNRESEAHVPDEMDIYKHVLYIFIVEQILFANRCAQYSRVKSHKTRLSIEYIGNIAVGDTNAYCYSSFIVVAPPYYNPRPTKHGIRTTFFPLISPLLLTRCDEFILNAHTRQTKPVQVQQQ